MGHERYVVKHSLAHQSIPDNPYPHSLKFHTTVKPALKQEYIHLLGAYNPVIITIRVPPDPSSQSPRNRRLSDLFTLEVE